MTTPLDSRPQESAAVGRLVAIWGSLEHELHCLLSILLGVDHVKAGLVHKSIMGTESKIALLERLNEQLPTYETYRLRIRALLKEANELNNDRNKYIHSLWGEDPETGTLFKFVGFLPRKPTKTDHEVLELTAADIDIVVDKIRTVTSGIFDLLLEIQLSTPAPQE